MKKVLLIAAVALPLVVSNAQAYFGAPYELLNITDVKTVANVNGHETTLNGLGVAEISNNALLAQCSSTPSDCHMLVSVNGDQIGDISLVEGVNPISNTPDINIGTITQSSDKYVITNMTTLIKISAK